MRDDCVWTAERRAAMLREKGLRPLSRTRPPTSPSRGIYPQAPDGFIAKRRIRVPADGLCFYHAVARSIGTLSYKVIMALVAAELEHKDQHEALQRVRNREWAETEEVSAAAHALKTKIHVFETANDMWITFGNENYEESIHLINYDMVHFEILR